MVGHMQPLPAWGTVLAVVFVVGMTLFLAGFFFVIARDWWRSR